MACSFRAGSQKFSRNPDEKLDLDKNVPQGLKPSSFSTLYGAAKAMPFQNNLENDRFWTGSRSSLLLPFPGIELLAQRLHCFVTGLDLFRFTHIVAGRVHVSGIEV